MRHIRKLYIISLYLSGVFVSLGRANAQKIVCHGILNLDGDVNHAIPVMNKMVKEGCNATMLTVWWDRVYPQPNSKPDYAQLDNQINHAINNLGIKVAIRIYVGRNYALTQGFWQEEESIKDFRGKVLTHYYDNNHFSFSHQPSIDKVKDFVREVCERYKNYQKAGKIIYISVVNTPQQELGYAYQNQQWPEKEYPAVFDHSKWSMIKWKDWAKEKYTNIRTLSAYWGYNAFKDFSEVIPYVNTGNVQDSFRGRWGKDWYLFRHKMLKEYYDQVIETIKSVDSTYKVACEFGGITDNLSLLRNTFAFKDLSVKADFLKTSTEGIQGDIAVSNVKPHQKLYTEVAFFDLQTPADLQAYVKRSVEYGCEFIMLIVESNNTKEFEKILPAVQEAVKWIDRPNIKPVFADSTLYRLSQLIDNRELVVNDWRIKSDNGKKKLKVVLEEDIIAENKKVENPLPDEVVILPTPIPTPIPEIILPPKQDGINQLPGESIKEYTKDIVVNMAFQFRIPENLYFDVDGYVAIIELLEAPKWLNFNPFELRFFGKAPGLGRNKVRLRVTDNNGGKLESTIYLNVVPPNIDFEVMTAEYFDTQIQTWGMLNDKRTLYLNALPSKINILAYCNLDSVEVKFDLTGPYKFNRTSDRTPFNLFGDGRGLAFPVGTYTLSANAYRNDTVVSSKKIQFFVVKSTISTENPLSDWQIYPNPFEQICNIKIPDNEDFTTLEFIIFTSIGQPQPIKKDFISLINNTAYLDLDHIDIPSGNYILEVNKSGQVLKRVRISKF